MSENSDSSTAMQPVAHIEPSQGGPERTDEKESGHPWKIMELLEHLVQVAERSEAGRLSVGEIVDAFGHRAYGPLLLLPAILNLLPLVGMIPGLAITTATWIILVAVQLCFSYERIWLPGRIKRFSISRDRLEWSVNKVRPFLKWLDKALKPRWAILTERPFTWVIAGLCILLALTMYPLAFIIAGVGPPTLIILLLALGLTTRDGIVVGLALILTGGCAWFVWYVLF